MQFETTTPTCEPQYPCPCRRGANLVPIYLTEAFGCDRCPNMFVLNAAGKLVEQLTGGYPQARVWRWTGNQWQLMAPSIAPMPRFLNLGLSLLFLLSGGLVLLGGWLVMGQWLMPPFTWLYWIVGILIVTAVWPRLRDRWGGRR